MHYSGSTVVLSFILQYSTRQFYLDIGTGQQRGTVAGDGEIRTTLGRGGFPAPIIKWKTYYRMLLKSFLFNIRLQHKIGDSATLLCSVTPRGQTPFIFKCSTFWIKESEDMETIEGSSVNLICNAGGTPQPESFGRNGTGDQIRFIFQRWWRSKKASVAYFEARADADEFKWLKDKSHGRETASLICMADGQPPPRYTWKQLDGPSASCAGRCEEGATLLTTPQRADAGRYACEVENGVGEALRKIVNLIVNGHPPKIQPFGVSDVLNEGESTKIRVRDSKSNSVQQWKLHLRSAEFGRKDTYSASLVVKAPPKWVTEPNSVEGLVDSFLSVDCQVSGYPPPAITWTKKNGTWTKQKRWRRNTHHHDSFKEWKSHFFQNFLLKTKTEFQLPQCVSPVAFALFLWLQDASSDSIDEGLPEIQPFNFPPRLSEGSSAKVLCNILHDSGNYTCNAENSVGKSSHTAHLVVEAPPFWIKTPHDVTGVYGSRLDMECAAAGSPRPLITWYKADDVIRDGAGRVVARGNGSLSINILTEEDEGPYRCAAHNGVGGGLSKEIKIVVNVPARFDEQFTVVTVKKGDSASLRCEAIGDQPLSVIWKKESKELRKINGGRYEIFETLTPKGLKSELVLREADRTDGQLYTCLTENPMGKTREASSSWSWSPCHPPGPEGAGGVESERQRLLVVALHGKQSHHQIRVAVLEGCSVRGRHRLEEKIVSSAQTSALIKDLHPGINYGLAIVAENTVGRGSPRTPYPSPPERKVRARNNASVMKIKPSGSPMDVNVDVKGAASLLVTWKPPPKSEWNGKLKGYYVGYKIMQDSGHPYSFKTVDYVPGGVQEHMITSLRKDTEYSILVKAYNSAGSGPPSQDVIVRTLGGDLPPPPIVFVVATSENSIKIQWRSTDTKSQLSGHAIHYRKKGESWQRVAVTSPQENSYTLTGLHGGAFYQLYVTANSDFGEGTPATWSPSKHTPRTTTWC
ncbi:contactin-4 [Caerostris extrusa]|uniref:Contactin-4 n=1 Tax=Caerostris extrusa TaxID=172846 RepID=A0AAV4QHZ8_CAEEX|nr:contactin-4 [Caerostris extrusa]